MFKRLAKVISIILFTSSIFFVGGEVAAQTSFNGIAEVSDPGPFLNGQDSTKRADDHTLEKLSSELRNFIKEVYTGQESTITGIFVNEGFSMDVIQQPNNSPGYIAPYEDTLTEFSIARDYGTIGLLAHNYLAGDLFFQLKEGQVVYLVFGGGAVQTYTIVDILSYQALQPNSPYSNFVNMENAEDYLSAADLFYKVYGQEDALVLQTCIENQGIESWGRLFIIAIPGAIPVNAGPM